MSRRIRVVFFDVGGTILTVRPSVAAIYSKAVERLGYRVDAQEVDRRFKGAWEKSLERRRKENLRCDDQILRSEWHRIVMDSFSGLIPETAALDAFEDLYQRFARADAWKLADRAVETFQSLTNRGLRLGVLSNWDSRLESTLDAVGVLKYFSLRVVSFQVGFEKPHPEMFKEAIRQAGVSPAEILHVGDSLLWDVEPAATLGLQTIWVRGEGTPRSESLPATVEARGFDHVLESIEANFDVLRSPGR